MDGRKIAQNTSHFIMTQALMKNIQNKKGPTEAHAQGIMKARCVSYSDRCIEISE
jgi:hypothetical protein